ncbi:aerobic respiration two-component sensor histidine kinase ArcB [Pseudaeromonas sharmana]|uniref:Aerobic respiration control sensor protein n=1 Tax=Pseudaeromonas sharmana TaxID=328412 RepID=A0ABV8CSH4_9GAMM
MRQIKSWAQYYVDWLTRLGIIKFSLLLAFFIILLAVAIQVGVTLLLRGNIDTVDIVRPVFFGLLVTPWAAYFLTAVVDELEDSRQRLTHMVSKLQEMRERDQGLNQQLQSNISQLHQQMEETRKAEAARQQAMQDLQSEIQRRKQTQVELEERSALLRSFIDSSPDLIYYRNEQGVFVGCNQAMEALTGKDGGELNGLTPHDVYSQDIADKVVETDGLVFSNSQPYTYEQWMEYPDGRRACFEMRKVPFYDAWGKRLGLLGFGRDITERKRYQEQLEQASREKTTFISTISHELRTPLNGIVGLSRILLETRLDDEQRRHMNTIHLSAVTLGNIFNDIIDLDKIDRHSLQLVPAPMDLPAFLSDLESLTRLMAEQKGLYLHFDLDGEFPEWVRVDGTRLRQVLWNLTGNAIKFTEQGGVTIRVMLTPLPDDKVHLRFDVEDTGVGIPHAEQEKIFAMYYQVDGRQRGIGTGIGLAVSRQLVEAMGGTVMVDSDPGQGSCFSVELTVEQLHQGATEVVSELPSLRILLVEDVELNITVATALLEKLGHQVTAARDGASALAVAHPDAFDLLLLDIQLPDMTGLDVADTLIQRYGASALPPMVALTANLIRDKADYLAHGLRDVIGKPLSADNLKRVLNHLFADTLPPPAPTAAVVKPSRPEVLDLDFLEDYAGLVGKAVLLDAVRLFDEMMPDYLLRLEENLLARDQAAIVSEAHKIKSAAGAIGLKRLHLLAKQAQSPELPAWWDNIADWIAALKESYPRDVARLKLWLQQ